VTIGLLGYLVYSNFINGHGVVFFVNPEIEVIDLIGAAPLLAEIGASKISPILLQAPHGLMDTNQIQRQLFSRFVIFDFDGAIGCTR